MFRSDRKATLDMATSSKTREVDKIIKQHPRPAEMKVLCLGLSRTSTMTMYTAMNKLGLKCYHMIETAQWTNKSERHLLCWLEALQYKVNGIGAPYGPEDFDKILQRYSAVTDMPCVNFAKELLIAFPNVKVVLTQREPTSWMKSMEASIYTILSWRIWPFLCWLDPTSMGAFHDTLQLGVQDWTSPAPWNDRPALEAYMPKHVEYIRSIVPKENLLEFHPRDGWEPLCKFIGKEVPEGAFPYVNKGNWTRNYVIFGLSFKVFKISLPYIIAGLAIYWGWKWKRTEVLELRAYN